MRHLIKRSLSSVISGFFSISRTCLLALLVSAETCQPKDPVSLFGLSEPVELLEAEESLPYT